MININKTKIRNILPDVETAFQERFSNLQNAVQYSDLSVKLRSELISNLIEASFASAADEIEAPLNDHKADLFVDGKPLEIKTASTSRVWRSGMFTKRSSDYLMVAYDDSAEQPKLFFLLTNLEEDDWKTSESENYYATTIDLDYILDNKEYVILRGDVEKKRKLRHLICS